MILMKDLINSILIGSLSTYLPFWVVNNEMDRITLAIGLSFVVYSVIVWIDELKIRRKK